MQTFTRNAGFIKGDGLHKLCFGTAGIPLSTAPYNTLAGIARIRELELDSMELEFVRSININRELAPQVKRLAEENGIVLSCHASYFVNLCSKEKEKKEASKKRITDAALRAHECGAFSVCFHAGFYQGRSHDEVYKIIKAELGKVVENLKQNSIKIWIRPETTGKATQFGTLEEILSLSQELEQVMPCIDFSHLHARTGKLNSYNEFCDILEQVESKLGKEALHEMHIHVSGIEYSEKGERHHLNLKDSDFRYKELMRALKEFGCKGTVISESPNIEKDALLMKKAYGDI